MKSFLLPLSLLHSLQSLTIFSSFSHSLSFSFPLYLSLYLSIYLFSLSRSLSLPLSLSASALSLSISLSLLCSVPLSASHYLPVTSAGQKKRRRISHCSTVDNRSRPNHLIVAPYGLATLVSYVLTLQNCKYIDLQIAMRTCEIGS